MLDMFKYSASNAAVQAGIGRLLAEAEWEALLEADDVDQFLSTAAGTPYASAIAESTDDNTEAIEKRLRQYMADRFRLPMPFLYGNARPLIDWLWRPFEIDNLIILLRGLHNQMPPARIRSAMIALGPDSELDWNGLSNARSVSDVIARMRTSRTGRFYARALQNAHGEYQRQNRVFILEVAIYIAYHRRLQDLIDDLSGRDRKEAERFIGTLIDSRNILWAYRFHLFFRLKPETILGYTLPRGGRVDAAIIQRAAAGAPLPEIIRSIWDDKLPDMERLEDRPPRQAIVELEIIFRRHLYRLALETLSTYPMHLGTVLAYLVLLQAEVDDMIAIIEGLVYRWPSERICSCLIGDRRSS